MNIPDIKTLKGGARGPRAIKKNYPDFYNYIMDNFTEDISFAEKLYWYFNNITTHPKCKRCGKKLRFLDGGLGYNKYCSSKCAALSQDTQTKRKITCIEKYGVEYSVQNKEVKEKTKNTYLERYGVDNPSKNKEIKEKAKKTCIERYGVDNPSKNKEIKERAKKTCIERYGVDNPSKNKEIKEKLVKTYSTNHGGMGFASSTVKEKFNKKCIDLYDTIYPTQTPQIKEKVKNTCLERYGVCCSLNSESSVKKTKNTCLERYGVEHVSQSTMVKEKIKNTCLERYGYSTNLITPESREKILINTIKRYKENHPEVLDHYYKDGQWFSLCSCQNKYCNKCDEKIFEIPSDLLNTRKYQGAEICTKLLPIGEYKNKNTTIELFIKNILDFYNIEYLCNDRSVLDGKEIDIYIPSKKIAIECNGTYWHCDKTTDKKYHYDKYINCLNKGIQLITIWEDQIINYPEIVKSIILSKLNIYDRKIYGRKCIIKELYNNDYKNFTINNHLQGHIPSSVKIGLFYEDELVSVMSFGKKRISLGNKKSDGWEMYRFCNKLNTQVIGGASKLMNYFINKYHPETIESFSSNDISNGMLYNKLGFTQQSINISYWYIKNNFRYHRYKFTKSNLVKMGYDSSKTEFEIMDELKYFRIYDSGQTKYILNIKNE